MTARPYDHVDVSIGGIMASTQSWSIGFTCAGAQHEDAPGSLSVGDMNDLAEDVRTWLASNMTNTKALAGTTTTIAAVRTYFRPSGSPTAVFAGQSTGAAITLSGSRVQAYQCAAVVTLLTGAAGRGNRGRIYWPFATTGPAIQNTSCTNLSTEFADLVAELRVLVSAIWGVAAGPVVGNNGLLVTRCRTDNVIDTQRRRRDKIAASFTSNIDVPIP